MRLKAVGCIAFKSHECLELVHPNPKLQILNFHDFLSENAKKKEGDIMRHPSKLPLCERTCRRDQWISNEMMNHWIMDFRLDHCSGFIVFFLTTHGFILPIIVWCGDVRVRLPFAMEKQPSFISYRNAAKEQPQHNTYQYNESEIFSSYATCLRNWQCPHKSPV